MTLFLKTYLFGKFYRYFFFRFFIDIATTNKSTMGQFHGFRIHIVTNDKGEILNFTITQANVDDRTPLKKKSFLVKIHGKTDAYKGYIGENLMQFLFAHGLHLITYIKNNMKNYLMTISDKVLLHKRSAIETVNDNIKNICQIEHSRHRNFNNLFSNIVACLIAYSFLSKKPSIKYQIVKSNQLTF